MKSKKIIETIGAMLILLFLYVAISKLLSFHQFIGAIHNQPFPSWAADLLIWTLPLMELLTAVLLFIPKTRLLGFYAASLLMTLFTGYVALILANGFGRIPCSCGGILKTMGWQSHLFFNLFFLFLSVTGIILIRKRTGPQSAVI